MSTFTDYLRKSRYLKMDNPRGDLVNDILRDRSFPETENLQNISDYLQRRLDTQQWKDFLVIRRSFRRAQSKR